MPLLRRRPKKEYLAAGTIPGIIEKRASLYPSEVAVELRNQIGTQWQKITADALRDQIYVVARGLIAYGLEPGDSVAIFGAASYEWTVLDFAAQSIGCVVVPVYESDSNEQISWIIEDSDIKFVVTDTSIQARVIDSLVRDRPTVLGVLAHDSDAMVQIIERSEEVGEDVLTKRLEALKPEDVATIIYTSGTTGRPKGVELTHANFMKQIEVAQQMLPQAIVHQDTRVLLFLPVAHVLARFINFTSLAGHGVIGHSSSIKNLLGDMTTFRPTSLLVVPRVLEKVYNAADAKAGSGMKLKMFRWAAHTLETYAKQEEEDTLTASTRAAATVARRLLAKIPELLGGNLRVVVSGGAPLSPTLSYFFQGLGIEVLEGYGTTEMGGPLTVCMPETNKTGSVGAPLLCNQVRLSDDGELEAKGPGIMRGYRNNPEATKEAFTADGWYKSGDLASIDEKGRVTITGRKKEIIVTAGGKNVSPAVLEDRLRGHPLISQVVVVGDQRNFISALITLDSEMLPGWLENHGLTHMEVVEAAKDKDVLASLDRAVKRANKAVSRAESIRKFTVLPTDFTEENGLLTPSLKVKRAKVLARFADVIDKMYEGAKRG